ncbi:CPBP family intramembrane glutamic endopeptidase [Rarobacter incanus]|uniref:CAAX prenyl protease-like protein n=1 Tax=Rarobacter incanus TaxID=153494 RepID=A0A542SQ51_9MICO|nr:CPBP family intramembrane glutamic endopeptidase [Rarobacter incanus]TQK76739.1 CAAX prenyl protease-like protein [Rarobacter incanus]
MSFIRDPRLVRVEILLVLALSLGQSAVYSVVTIVARLTAGTSLGQQSTSLNSALSDRPLLDLTYQLLAIAFTLVPAGLAVFLLARDHPQPLRLLGLTRTYPARDTLHGLVLAAAIGLPGIALYIAGRALGITVSVSAADLSPLWWAPAILILRAIMNAVLEEVIVVGYLSVRAGDLRCKPWAIVAASALLRGTYHLYQGIGPFVGNVAMGIVFAAYYRWRGGGRTLPLVIAHSVLDVVAFVGYQYIPHSVLAAFGIT